jgi:hypothetical protein
MRTGLGSKWILVVRLRGGGALALPTVGSDSNDKLTMLRIHERTSGASFGYAGNSLTTPKEINPEYSTQRLPARGQLRKFLPLAST